MAALALKGALKTLPGSIIDLPGLTLLQSVHDRYLMGVRMTQSYETVDRQEYAKLVTPKETRKIPIHNWFVYPHSYSPKLVNLLLDDFGIAAGQTVLDPFVGAGTTILAAKQRGISAVGLDILPVSAVLVGAKVAEYDAEKLRRVFSDISKSLNRSKSDDVEIQAEVKTFAEPSDNFIGRAFSIENLAQIVRVKQAISYHATESHEQAFFMIGLLGLLEQFSLTLKSGGWLKMLANESNLGNLIVAFKLRVQTMISDIESVSTAPAPGTWRIVIGDARLHQAEIGPVDGIITSPPYPNRHDYTRVLMVELLIGFLKNSSDLKPLRHSLLRSHIESKLGPAPKNYAQPQRLTLILEQLQEKRVDYRVPKMIKGYFEDMFLALQCCKNYLVDGARAAFVLGNVRFSGLSIPVDELVAEIGEQAGLKWEHIYVARRRNNSAQQMRDFGKERSRESVIVWRKPPLSKRFG